MCRFRLRGCTAALVCILYKTSLSSLLPAAGSRRDASGSLLDVVSNLLFQEPHSRHRKWLASRPDCQDAVVEALLLWCLPGLAAAF